MPHQASVVTPDMIEPRIVNLRRRLSAMICRRVNEVKLRSSADNASADFSCNLARRAATLDHCPDSGTLRRSHRVNNAGSTPSRNMYRQESSPSPDTKCQVADATKKPSPRPHCIKPAAFALAWAGHISATQRCPGPPLRADHHPGQEAQDDERFPVPRQCGQPGEGRVQPDGQHQHLPTAEVVGHDPAEDAADAPAE